MFKNPLKKYQQGGNIANARAQVIQAIAEVTGAEPEDINSILDQISGNEQAIATLGQALSMAKEGKREGIEMLLKMFPPRNKTQIKKQGGKIHDFICKHAKGGAVDCGCSKPITKAEQGGIKWTLLPRRWRTNDDGSTASIQIAIDPQGRAIERIITDRSRVTNRDGLPVRDTSNLGGYYTDGEFISDGDITFGSEVNRIFDQPKQSVNKKAVIGKQEGGMILKPFLNWK